jgi:ferric-dicitrate binding protein FerR (iron transport regulator)
MPVRLLRIAAAMALAVGLSYWLTGGWNLKYFSPPFSGTKTVSVPSMMRSSVTLEDGTRVILDAGSMLRYPKAFKGKIREVVFEGEGFFDVAHDPEKPFRVRAGDAVIQVLGTRFNVNAWKDRRRVTVAVEEGKVAFGAEKEDERNRVFLTQNQMSQIRTGGIPDAPKAADITAITGWMRDRIDFDGAPLADVLSRVELWYGVRIKLENPVIATEHVSIHIQRTSIREVLDLISMVSGLRYTMRDSEIRLAVKMD